MKINFTKEYLRELYEDGKTTEKKYRFQPHIISRYQLRIETLSNAESIDEIKRINSLRYEILRGEKKGISSIRVNDQYRIEFTIELTDTESVVTICNILELSNHYK
jgi:proteic killer suppression protein